MFDYFHYIVRLYETGEKAERIQADEQIRKKASNFELTDLLALLKSPHSSLHEKMAAALAIGYHYQSGRHELKVLFDILEKSKGEPTTYAYRILSAIRKLLSKGVRFQGMHQFYSAVNYYRLTGGKDTSTVANMVYETMHQAERMSDLAPPMRSNKLAYEQQKNSSQLCGKAVFFAYPISRRPLVLELSRDIERKLNIKTVLMDEESHRGQTLVEKFEYLASSCGFGVFLLTGDNECIEKTEKGKKIVKVPRQNVIFELGYFVGRLGRMGRIAILREPDVKIPTDLEGLGWIPITSDLAETKNRLAQELKDAGLVVP